MPFLSIWWVWVAGALILGILEVVAPAQVFLGFALGAAGVGFGLLLEVPGLGNSVPVMLVVFGALSLVAWLVLRQVLGIREGQVKHFTHDINED